ncbi:MAG TPA: type IV pilus secretin PilQ [Thermoanaerobaculia bacterium]|jgi:type IV pilus assembly protein PilQ|nr:type IV pilus secretin PilQ [Thermoanaerobaculia bacterium]
MGKVRSRRQPFGWAYRASLGLLAAALLLGCASGAKTGPAQGAAAPAASTSSESQASPARITSLQMREAAPGVRLELQATAPLVWTQYRDSEGRLVLELPNSTAAPGVGDLGAEGGIVQSVTVRQVDSGDRPLTRLVIVTHGETEHELAASGNTLQLTLVPAGSEQAMASAPEPVPPAPAASAPPPTAPVETAPPVQRAAAAPAATGTPDAPYVAPPPAGVVATRLRDVVIETGAQGPVVRIQGDGDFAYSTFQLADPPRFVIDLQGVTNAAPRATVVGSGAPLQRVRIAQFKAQPSPISRVVLDLAADVVPHLTSSGQGLVVTFDQGMAASAPPATWPQPTAAPSAAAETAAPAPVQQAQAPPAPAPATSAGAPTRIEITGTKVATAPASPSGAEPSDVGSLEAVEVQDVTPTYTDQKQAAPAQFQPRDVSQGGKKYVGEPISFSLRDADIKEVLRTFAKISGLNMVIQPGISGPVTVELDQVPWDQALEIILKTNGLGYELDGNIMRIAPIGMLNEEARQEAERRNAAALAVPLRTVLKRISYANAAEIAGLLRSGAASILSARGSVVVDARTNTLIIKELPEFMNTVLDVIDQVDVPEPQVMIEARIVETTKRFNRTLGIHWGFTGVADQAHGNTTGLVFPNNATGSGSVNLLSGGQNALLNLRLGNVLNTFNLDAQLQAAESEGLINILSAPKVATVNNQLASIQSGLEIPIQTVANNTVTVQYVNATLRLNVTPHITADGTVMMDIEVQKREPLQAFLVVGATNAPISTKEARTRVIVRDGGTTVIGGIYRVTSDQGEDRVPGLAGIPILGHLFRNKRHNNENEELLIFITPRVIKL